MKQTFDLVSHFFALLPLSVLWINLKNLRSKILFIFLIVATVCSIVYHSIDKTHASFHALHTIDRFTSCTIIILTFWLYIDKYWYGTLICVAFVLFFVLLEAENIINDLVLEGLVSIQVILALVIFVYEGYEDNFKKPVYNVKDPFFGSFFLTQSLAIFFFLQDTPPYYHSLWHLFAFTSLGSVIAHSSKTSEDTVNDYVSKNKALFYWIGSLPCRLFISWILIDLHSGEGSYIALVFLLIAMLMLPGFVFTVASYTKYFEYSPRMQRQYVYWKGIMNDRRMVTMTKGTLTYFTIAGLLFAGFIGAAGWVLLIDTVLSACIWWWKATTDVTTKSNTIVYKKIKPTLQLDKLVF